MSQRQWIVIIGAWVVVFLFLGFPSSWDKGLAVLTGVLIIAMAYRIRFKEAPPKEAAFKDSHAEPPRPEPSASGPAAPSYQHPPASPDVA